MTNKRGVLLASFIKTDNEDQTQEEAKNIL